MKIKRITLGMKKVARSQKPFIWTYEGKLENFFCVRMEALDEI